MSCLYENCIPAGKTHKIKYWDVIYVVKSAKKEKGEMLLRKADKEWRVVCLFVWIFFVFIFERETECEWRRGRERGRHRIWSRLQVLRYKHRVQRRARTHKPQDHDLSQSWTLNWLVTQAPQRVCSWLWMDLRFKENIYVEIQETFRITWLVLDWR